MSVLFERILAAHGGAERWQRLNAVMAVVSMGGLEFTSRFQAQPLRDAEVTVSTAGPDVAIAGYPRAGVTAHFQPSRVWLQADDGTVLEERTAPGTVFHSPRHWLWWDTLDVTYYCGLTLWQTLCMPFLLLREGCYVEELDKLTIDGERYYRLSVRLPCDIPSLSAELTLYADATGLLRRIDSVPRLYGSLLRVGQVLEDNEECDGLVVSTRRRTMTAMPGGHLVSGLSMGWINLDDIRAAELAS